MNTAQFEAVLMDTLGAVDRKIVVNSSDAFGTTPTIYVNFFNLPRAVAAQSDRAELENNRALFSVSIAREGKVKIEHMGGALPRSHRMRAKTADLVTVARHLGLFLATVVREIEPKYTHTKIAQ